MKSRIQPLVYEIVVEAPGPHTGFMGFLPAKPRRAPSNPELKCPDGLFRVLFSTSRNLVLP